MKALGAVEDDSAVAAHLLGTVYELAMRLNATPRSIADNAFMAVASDDRWRAELEPALRASLERE